jgi:hypothetical protein
MRVITLSIASLLSARRRRSSHVESDEVLLVQISPAMMQHLLRRGWLLEIEFLVLPAVIVFILQYAVGWFFPDYGLSEPGHYVAVTAALLLSRLFSWRSLGQGAVNMEVRYRHEHGKRWER